MPRGRPPIDKSVRIARTMTGLPPSPHHGPIAQAYAEEVKAKELDEQLRALKAAATDNKR